MQGPISHFQHITSAAVRFQTPHVLRLAAAEQSVNLICFASVTVDSGHVEQLWSSSVHASSPAQLDVSPSFESPPPLYLRS